MKSEKPSLKKTVKDVTKSIREKASAVAAKLKTPKTTAAKAPSAAALGAKPADKIQSKETTASVAPKKATVKARKKAPAKKEAIPVPPILLEGDQPAAPAATGPGQRYALGPVPPPEHLGGAEHAAELPEAYGTQRLLLTARDPHWLYARWDMTREQQRKYNRLSTDGHLVLQIFIDAVKGQPYSQIHVHPESNHWFVPVDLAGKKYLAVLGYYESTGNWIAVTASDATLTPPDTMSEDTTAEFATIPIEVPFAHILELARAAVRENIPLVEVILQLRASGYRVAEAPTGRWTAEQERALASIITMDRVRRVWMGSMEITELIRRRLQQEISSIAAAQFSLPSSPMGAISSISSPFGIEERKKGFWFNVNAELILYGATEPDAQVTIGGRVIKLRSDGTFSYRFALPDGQYELPAVAVSSDKTDARAADLKFGRSTEYRGDVGTHPQDPQLKAPLVANVA